MLSVLQKQLEFDNKLLRESPEGRIYSVRRGEKLTYFQVMYCEEKRKRVSINKKPDLIKALSRKKYLLKKKKTAGREYSGSAPLHR